MSVVERLRLDILHAAMNLRHQQMVMLSQSDARLLLDLAQAVERYAVQWRDGEGPMNEQRADMLAAFDALTHQERAG